MSLTKPIFGNTSETSKGEALYCLKRLIGWNYGVAQTVWYLSKSTTAIEIPILSPDTQSRIAEASLPTESAGDDAPMHFSSVAQTFLEANPALRTPLASAESVARKFYAGAQLSVDIDRDEATCHKSLCIFIEPTGDYEDALSVIGEFNRSWVQAIGKEFRASISFCLM
jgi:hypothetical protein